MADPRGFLNYERRGPRRRPIDVRVRDWREIYEPLEPATLVEQAGRCMDCGIPFCHEGCPLGNLIPEWNDLVRRGRPGEASERLHATNNFPELTGRLCPAPCEGSCVLGIDGDAVTIKQVELEIAERAFADGVVAPVRPAAPSGYRVAVVGSGPAGLAAAQQLARAGHAVVVFERAERPGGLLRYGIPEFKLEKAVLDRRLAQLSAEGVELRTRTRVGAVIGERDEPPGAAAGDATTVPAEDLVAGFDAVLLACGSTMARELPVPGRQLAGVHLAMEYLKPSNLACEGTSGPSPISAAGTRVVIVGGGDTGADCLGTAHRQGAVSVHQLEILPRPPDRRGAENPWPTWPLVFRTSSAHEEGGERLYAASVTELHDDGTGRVGALTLEDVEQRSVDGRPTFVPLPGSARRLECDLVLLALGFTGAERNGLVAELGLELAPSGAVARDGRFASSRNGIFVCGDMGRGQSLVVWAIAEGRAAAAAVDAHLTGRSELPSPIVPAAMAIR
jgi:glutamate synthase (NADPH/NADH) small chain